VGFDIDMVELFIALFLAIGVSAFCSVSEAAFYSISNASIEKLVQDGKRSGLYLRYIKENMDSFIASVLILNTAANTYGVYMATSFAVREFPENIHLIFPWLLTLAILLFAEIIPKTVGVSFSKKMAPFVAGPFLVINRIFTWTGLVWVTSFMTRIFTRRRDPLEDISAEEILHLSALSAQEGVIDKQQEMVIQRVLSFNKYRVREIMTPRPVIFSLDQSWTVRESIEKMGDWPFSRVPVYAGEREKLVGVVLRREAYTALAEGENDVALKKLLRPLEFVPDGFPLDGLLSRFLKEKIHILGVADEYGGLAGIVTMEDVLEELLGKQIIDEFDQDVDLQEKARRSSPALWAMQIREQAKRRANRSKE